MIIREHIRGNKNGKNKITCSSHRIPYHSNANYTRNLCRRRK